MSQLILEKKSTHSMRPCFVLDERYKRFLTKFLNKEELIKPKSQSSIYQKGFQMTFCNPVPIAAACYLHKNVVVEGLNAIFNAIYDLVQYGKNILLKFGFCNLALANGTLSYTFNEQILNLVTNLEERETKVSF